MKTLKNLTYYHPTTWVIVDDQETFLRDLESVIPEGRAYSTFVDPMEALRFVEDSNHRYSNTFRSVFGDMAEKRELVGGLDSFSLVDQYVVRPVQSSAVVSVVVCDFLMPKMDGIDFFSRLESESVRKILLTGAADEKMAVDAFNGGLIDHFLMKGRDSVISSLWNYCADSELDFFRSMQSPWINYFSNRRGPFSSQQVWDLLWQRFDSGEYVRFCCAENPSGFVVTRLDGSRVKLLFFGRREYDHARELAVSAGAPAVVLEKIAARKVILYHDGGEPLGQGDEIDWDTILVPASELGSSGLYWYGEYEEPALELI